MKEIKTRDTIKDIRTLDRAANVAGRMKNAYIRTKEQAEQTQQANTDSPVAYAEDRTTENAHHVARETGHKLHHHEKRLSEKTRQKIRERHTQKDTPEPEQLNLKKNPPKHNSKNPHLQTYPYPHMSRINLKIFLQITPYAARALRETAQAAKAATKAAIVTGKAMVKAIVATAKVIISGVKSLIAAIAAGGWVAVVVIIVIFLAASLLGSVFGIFASEEGYDGAPSIPEVVSQLNEEFSDKFDSIIANNPHDALVIDNAGSASMVANWDEVLAVYDVLVATDPENSTEVATLDDKKIEKLRTVFWDMNHISYYVDEVEIGTDEESGDPITETVLTITVSTSTAEDMISYYGLSTERGAQVRELLQPEYAKLFQRLTGSYVDITLSADEIADIIETLPNDLSEERTTVVLTAYSLLDKVSYFWGGKSLVIGWDSRWGTPMKVTAADSSKTGTVRPFGLDCSGFVDWVFYNAYDGGYIIGHGGGATAQYGYCEAVTWNNAQPGDLVFYPECEHVGIVVKNNAGALTITHCASGYNNVVMTEHTQGNGFAFVGSRRYMMNNVCEVVP